MPNWKKLIVSGSDAILNTVTASGFLGNLTGTASWATNANNLLVTDADTAALGSNLPLLFGNGSYGVVQPVYGDTELTYNASTNTLTLAATTTQSFGNNTLLSMANGAKFVMGDTPIVNIGTNSAGKYADVYISGSVNIIRSGSAILTVSGSGGAIMNIADDNSATIFEVVSGSNTLFAVDSGPTVIMSGSVLMYALPTSSTAASILTYNSSTGQVFSSSPPSKAGSASAASFGGSPRTSSVTFATAYPNNNYSVTVTGTDARTWTIQSKTAAGFTINSNSSTALTGATFWIASAW